MDIYYRQSQSKSQNTFLTKSLPKYNNNNYSSLTQQLNRPKLTSTFEQIIFHLLWFFTKGFRWILADLFSLSTNKAMWVI